VTAFGRQRAAWSRPGRVSLVVAGVLVVAYALQLIATRLGVPVVQVLALTPETVVERGWLWQVLTYALLHSPGNVSHLLFNLIPLVMFGAQLEPLWGPRKYITGVVVCALGGGLLTLLVGVLTWATPLGELSPGFWMSHHLGASGATTGLTVAWGVVFANREVSLLFMPPMKGRTFVWIVLAIELLSALSFSEVSSTAHFGGMAAGALFASGLWRPTGIGDALRRRRLKRQRAKLERELRVIEGGRGKDDLLN